MPTPGQISKENLKQILVFFPAVVYNICVVLFSFQLNYTTQKRICPACGLQILFCLLGAFFHSPLFRSSISHAVPIAPRLSLDSVAAALDRGDFESGSDSKSGRLTSDALFPLHHSLRRRGGGLRAYAFAACDIQSGAHELFVAACALTLLLRVDDGETWCVAMPVPLLRT